MSSEKKFKVQALPWFSKRTVEFTIPGDVDTYFGEVKRIAAVKFGLEVNSRHLFGLFELHPCIPSMMPLKLYMDWDIVPGDEYLNLGLLKRCFSRIGEKILLGRDNLATELFYYETKSMYEAGSFIGSPKLIAQAACVELWSKTSGLLALVPNLVQYVFVPPQEDKYFKQFEHKDAAGYASQAYFRFTAPINMHGTETTDSKKMYMETMHCLNRFYWSYFHKVVGCTLCGDFAKVMAPYMNLNDRFEVVVTLNATCLSILGVTAANQFLHLVDFPWIGIYSVKMNRIEKTFSFQALFGVKDTKFVTISIRTDYFEYLFTIALYILKLQISELNDIDFKSPHILTKRDLTVIEWLKPPSIDHENFLCMVLPLNFLQFLGEKMNFKFDPFQPLEIPPLPEVRDVACEAMCINAEFRPVAFRLKRLTITAKQMKAEKEPGYLKIIRGKNTCTIPFYSSDTAAEFFSCSKIDLPINIFSRVITIHTFLGVYKIPMYSKSMSVLDFKKIICKFLRLTKNAPQSFMLSSYSKSGSLSLTNRVYLIVDRLPKNVSQFVFRRSGLYPKEEQLLWQEDLIALNMLYSEAKHLLENGTVLPAIVPTVVNLLKKICQQVVSVEDGDKSSGHQDIKNKIEFLKVFSEASSFWWHNYHRIEDVSFPNMKQHIIELFYRPLCMKPRLTTLTISHAAICFLNEYGDVYYRRISTARIRAVLLDVSQTIIFEILTTVRSREGASEVVIIPLLCFSEVAGGYIFPLMHLVLTISNFYKSNKTGKLSPDTFVNQSFGPSVERRHIKFQCINFYASL